MFNNILFQCIIQSDCKKKERKLTTGPGIGLRDCQVVF